MHLSPEVWVAIAAIVVPQFGAMLGFFLNLRDRMTRAEVMLTMIALQLGIEQPAAGKRKKLA